MQTSRVSEGRVAEQARFDDGELVSIADAIRISRRSRQVLLAAALAGRLCARLISGRVFITKASLDEYMR